MIDVKGTLLETIKDNIKKMRYLAENNPKVLKKILSLIVVDDLYEWSIYLHVPQSVLQRLKDMRTNYIMCLKIFNILYEDPTNYYVNVNTPQTELTWKRLWDAPSLNTGLWDRIERVVNPDLHPEPFTPDPTCVTSVTYYGGESDEIPSDELGYPYVDFSTLTVCEKMNIFINRETGLMFVINPECGNLVPITVNTGSVDWSNINNKPDIYTGVEHEIDNNRLTVKLNKLGNIPSSVDVTDSNPDLTNLDLNDIVS